MRKSGFFRTAGKYQVNIETGRGGPAEIRYNSWNRFPTNLHSDGSESTPTNGDAEKSTVPTATNEHTQPLFLSDDTGNDKFQPINVRLTQRKPYRSPVTTSNNVELPIHVNTIYSCRTTTITRKHKPRQNAPRNNLANIPILRPSRQNIKHTLPNILLFNARSLFNKIDELTIIINQQNADVIMVTETWLTDVIPDEALHIPDFNIVTRKDRPTRRGGGVAVYIRESLPFKIRPDFYNSDYECLWITLRPKWLPRKISKLALARVYLPPSMNTEALESFYEYCCYCYDSLICEGPNTSIIITGDFNP